MKAYPEFCIDCKWQDMTTGVISYDIAHEDLSAPVSIPEVIEEVTPEIIFIP